MANQSGMIRQAAVIPVRGGQVCLVTSRGGKRWVVPKGNLEAGKSASEIALQEAWEEAGLVGLLHPGPVGTYFYEKDGFICHVLVFMMTVTGNQDIYPEAGLRQRIWLPMTQAVNRVEEVGLRDLLRAFSLTRTSELRSGEQGFNPVSETRPSL